MASSWRRRGLGSATGSLATSQRVLVALWHCILVLLQLTGILGCSGWPPRWSRAWTSYAFASLVALSIFRATIESRQHSSALMSYVDGLYTIDTVLRAIALALVQVVMVHYSSAVSLLVRAVLLHLHSFPAPKRKQVTRHAVLICFGTNAFFYTSHFIYHKDFYFATWRGVRQLVVGLLPTLLISTTQDSFTCIVSASVDSLASVADGVKEVISSLLRREPDELGGEQGDVVAVASCLRALRVRYQCVQDVVHATNWLYGWCNLVIGSFSLLRSVTFLYCGVIVTMAYAAMLGDFGGEDLPFDSSDGVFFLIWGTVLIGKLIFICAIGEQMSSESSRISDALQAGITRYPDMDPSVKQEIQWFICQTQRQEIRFGAFDLFYFDLTTMNRIIASGMTCIVVLVQFSAIIAHERGHLKEQSDKTV